MSDHADDQLPDELRPVISRLRAERLDSDPVELDQLKRRVINRVNRQGRTGGFMKSRLATGVTLLALIGGSGGAVAIGTTGGASVASKQKAAQSQYTPGKKTVKCHKGFHKVKNRCVRNKVVIKKKPSPKRLTGPAFTGARDHR
jgi:hypothetical protein